MAESGEQNIYAFDAAGDLSAAQYHIMRISDGVSQVNISSLNTASDMIGVLQNRPAAAGRHASVAYRGISKVVAGAAVNSAGVFLTTNGSGRAVAATSGHMVVGRALSTVGADGEVLTAMLYQPFRLSGAI